MRKTALALVLLLFVACSDDVETKRPDPEPAPTETAALPTPNGSSEEENTGVKEFAGQTIPLQVWFLKPNSGDPDEGFHELYLHHVAVTRTEAIGRAAIEQLLRGVPPDLRATEVYSIVPEGTELLGLTIEGGGTAVVDFNRRFEQSGMGTSGGEPQLAQVVYTLTQFPTVKRVAFEIEGERIGGSGRPFGGHGEQLPRFQTRKYWESMLPPIVVESPHAGEKVSDVIFMTGIANVFEATVGYRLRSKETGRILQKGFTTATCGTGCYGTFSQMIPLEFPPQSVVLEVFESSAEDGRPLHLVRIPLVGG